MLPPVKLLQLISDNRITFLPIGQNQTYLKQLIKQAYSLLSSCRTLISETLSRISSQLLRLMNQSFFSFAFYKINAIFFILSIHFSPLPMVSHVSYFRVNTECIFVTNHCEVTLFKPLLYSASYLPLIYITFLLPMNGFN